MMLIPRLANMMYDQAQEKLRRAEGNNKQVSRPPHDLFAGVDGSKAPVS